jgi:hypothetical protein
MHRTLRVISESGIDRGDDRCFKLQIIFRGNICKSLVLLTKGESWCIIEELIKFEK